MGCEIVVGGGNDGDAAAVERLFEALEAALSRFRPTSDLERLNEAPAGTVIVSPSSPGPSTMRCAQRPRPAASAIPRSLQP